MSNKKSELLLQVSGANDPLEKHLKFYIDAFIANNRAAQVVANGLRVVGVGFRPVIDHVTFRTLNVEKRAKEFISLGYKFDKKLGILEYDHWWAKVYRKPGYPAIFIDQAYNGKRGKKSTIPKWVEAFGENSIQHLAILVDDIENAAFYIEKQGIPMDGNIIGFRGSDLRQVFTKPDMKGDKPFTVLELTERHRGFSGFLPPKDL